MPQTISEFKKMVCCKPFYNLDIYENGLCGFCCPPFNEQTYIGNIFYESIENIWNGKIAQDFRKAVLENTHKYCNHPDMCANIDCIKIKSDSLKIKMDIFPKIIDLCLDTRCNCHCVMCRDINNRIDDDILKYIKLMKKNVRKKIIPLLKDCKIVSLNGSGEPFVSEICKDFIKETAIKYPNLKYIILTNGILCTEKMLKELGILNNRISNLAISLHSATKETYNKILRPIDENSFEKVMENIKQIKKLYKKKLIKNVYFSFVISSYNYQELPLMAEFCIKNDIEGRFWEFRKWDDSKMCAEYDKYNVTDKNHPEYPKLKKILSNKIFDNPRIILNGVLENISK